MDKAEQVAYLARQYAHRRRHLIPHTGHTVHRLLDAVSALLGQRVSIVDPVVGEADRAEHVCVDDTAGRGLCAGHAGQYGGSGSATR